MATFTGSDDLEGAEFVGADLRGARFVETDLSGVVMRGVEVAAGGHRRTVARPRRVPAGQRRRRDPVRRGRAQPPVPRPGRPARRGSGRPARRLGRARAHLGQPRSSASRRCQQARSTCRWPASGRSRRRCGTWSWPRTCGCAGGSWRSSSRSIPSVCRDAGTESDGSDAVGLRDGHPVVRRGARGPRRTAWRWCATSSPRVTSDELAATRKNPHDPEHAETTRSCLHVILEEEWEHHRFAVRDLDAIEAMPEA